MGSARALVEPLVDGPIDGLAGVLADDAEWWVAGDPARLPWAGSFKGPDGFRRFIEALRQALDYHKFETVDVVDAGNSFVQIVQGAGVARSTGRPFTSLIARVFTERDGRVILVRTFYDTAAYERALL
ncbi:MAG: hypothetical protein PVS3B2_17750 [Candidatus Dormibacteraceae bacterium]